MAYTFTQTLTQIIITTSVVLRDRSLFMAGVGAEEKV
jgi:hypothetical protein